jgi:hypothetical protein
LVEKKGRRKKERKEEISINRQTLDGVIPKLRAFYQRSEILPARLSRGCKGDPHSTHSLRSFAQGRLSLRLKNGFAQDDVFRMAATFGRSPHDCASWNNRGDAQPPRPRLLRRRHPVFDGAGMECPNLVPTGSTRARSRINCTGPMSAIAAES